jgi:hypothetical protein
MGKFILRNNLYLMTALAVLVAAFIIWHWESIPVLQRMVGLFFVALVMHLWEEQRIPGGFVELITEHLHFTADRHFGEIITIAYVLVIAFVPLFFPHVAFLAMATMMLGIMEAVMHIAMIRMFKLPYFYSPGLATAVLLLLPISIYTFTYAIRNDLMQPLSWLLAFLYMLLGLVVAQQMVIGMRGMKYTDFLKSVQAALKGRKASA